MKKLLLSTLVSSALLSQDPCVHGINSRLALRHREDRGIGYDDGYTTLDGYLMPNWDRKFMPLLNARGHIFNDGRYASNIGIGARYAPWQNWAFGSNFYYDFRSARILRAHQLGLGAEVLSKWFDFRFNGYWPIANSKKEPPFVFDKFIDNPFGGGSLTQVRSDIRMALGSVFGEFGFPIPGAWARAVDLYFAVGPYYLMREKAGSVNKKACGGTAGVQGRLTLQAWDGLEIGAQSSYDQEFKSLVQGYASFSLPFGPANLRTKGRRWRERYTDSGCETSAQRQRRLTQDIRRNEIIPICKQTEKGILTPAGIVPDPVPGIPSCIFFNYDPLNIPPIGSGTFDDPYRLLVVALNNLQDGDCLYVFNPGQIIPQGSGAIPQIDLTGFTDILIHGAGVPFIVSGVEVIPAAGFPIFDAFLFGSAIPNVILGENITIRGIEFRSQPTTGGGIDPVIIDTQLAGTTNFNINNNRFINRSTNNQSTIRDVGSASGTKIISNNFFTTASENNIILAAGASRLLADMFLITGNTFESTNIQSGDQFIRDRITSEGPDNATLIIQNNTFDHNASSARSIQLRFAGTSDFTLLIDNNSLDTAPFTSTLFQVTSASSGTLDATITNNSSIDELGFASYFVGGGELVVSGNTGITGGAGTFDFSGSGTSICGRFFSNTAPDLNLSISAPDTFTLRTSSGLATPAAVAADNPGVGTVTLGGAGTYVGQVPAIPCP